MKKGLAAASVLLICAALLFFSHSRKSSPVVVVSPPPNSLGVASVAASNAGSNASKKISSQVPPQPPGLAAQAGELITDSSPRADLPPGIVLQNVGRAVHQYGEMFDGNPVGTNPEITSQLSGNNARHVNFINTEAGMRVNANGELVDAWGTPYFFHQISGSEMEIHSAGPDKTMWTSDDLVVK